MYWNFTKYNPSSPTALINYNMRCIETSSNFSGCCFLYSDKLQHEMYWNGAAPIGAALSDADKLQHEMYWNTDPKLHPVQPGAINYNMRCIETVAKLLYRTQWTDKLQHEMYWNKKQLHRQHPPQHDKLQHEMYWNICCDACHGMGGWINYNMRCIETPLLCPVAKP